MSTMSSPNNSSSAPSSRLKDWWSSLPFATKLILAVNVSIHVIACLIGFQISTVCFNPVISIGPDWQLWRFFTNPFFHVGILHIAMNMMTLVAILPEIERTHGSGVVLYLSLLFLLLVPFLTFVLSWAAHFLVNYDAFLYECAIGYSGILFSFLIVSMKLNPNGQRSVFGFFNVPALWYPWVLLAIIQVIMPGVSFIGHLSGIVAAYFNDYFLRPSQAFASVKQFEASSALFSSIYRLPSYVSAPGNSNSNQSYNSSSSSSSFLSRVRSSVSNTWATIVSYFSSIRTRSVAGNTGSSGASYARLGANSRDIELEQQELGRAEPLNSPQ